MVQEAAESLETITRSLPRMAAVRFVGAQRRIYLEYTNMTRKKQRDFRLCYGFISFLLI